MSRSTLFVHYYSRLGCIWDIRSYQHILSYIMYIGHCTAVRFLGCGICWVPATSTEGRQRCCVSGPAAPSSDSIGWVHAPRNQPGRGYPSHGRVRSFSNRNWVTGSKSAAYDPRRVTRVARSESMTKGRRGPAASRIRRVRKGYTLQGTTAGRVHICLARNWVTCT